VALDWGGGGGATEVVGLTGLLIVHGQSANLVRRQRELMSKWELTSDGEGLRCSSSVCLSAD
jgi:hypothetical protein